MQFYSSEQLSLGHYLKWKLYFICLQDDFTRNLRVTVMRYVNLSIVLVFRLVSTKVEERFPTYQSLVDAKLMLPHEKQRLIQADIKTPHESTWTPVLWALKLLERARSEKNIQKHMTCPLPCLMSVFLSSVIHTFYPQTCYRWLFMIYEEETDQLPSEETSSPTSPEAYRTGRGCSLCKVPPVAKVWIFFNSAVLVF